MVFSPNSLWWVASEKVESLPSKPASIHRPPVIPEALPVEVIVEASSDVESQDGSDHGLQFMDLPLEIRLQIYHWVLLMHPLKHAQLAPWYPTPTYSAYHVGLVQPSCPPSEEGTETKISNRKISEPKLLCPDRPICGLPTPLLRCSKQIYHEARHVPFVENEFVFVNWFSSGLWAARAFTRPLSQWQKDATRYVRLELLARDFTGAGLKEWVTLCEAWSSSLRGLRLKILIGGGVVEPAIPFAELNNTPESDAMNLFSDPEPRPAWIKEGLEKLRSIETIEVELACLDWDNDKKLEWCASLERMLVMNTDPPKNIRVACVAKLPTSGMTSRGICPRLGGTGDATVSSRGL